VHDLLTCGPETTLTQKARSGCTVAGFLITKVAAGGK
jgi:hypothetical protein